MGVELRLEDKVFQVLGLTEDLAADSQLRDVTISHLLQHVGGWDSSTTFDPLFATDRILRVLEVEPPVTQPHIIEFMLRQPLQFAPGERYAYSNFGYMLLGRVIETRSGRSYEDYVKEEVLVPIGVTSMQLGRSFPEDRAEGEVTYYDEAGRTRPSLLDPERILSHAIGAAAPFDVMKRIILLVFSLRCFQLIIVFRYNFRMNHDFIH